MKTGIFNPDFFPTPIEVIETMLSEVSIIDKTILEPSAGKGDIVDYLLKNGAENVIACEKSPELATILATKCRVINPDFLKVKSEDISHIHAIIMNPPFSADEKHILHAWEIAPAGCHIVSLCNSNTLQNQRYSSRREIAAIIEEYGQSRSLGQCFTTAERPTEVEVSLIRLLKPGENTNSEFDGFFMEEDPAEQQANAIMPYNFVRDLVNRYITAIKIFDEQLDAAVRMNNLTDTFYGSSIALSFTEKEKPKKRNEYKIDLQQAAWKFVFNKMDIDRIATRGLREDINKFVNQQQKIPFSMRNIYRMLDIVIGTTEQRMDKALLEVFNGVTKHYNENRFNVEGWKTNSHYLLNRKFIMPHIVEPDFRGSLRTTYYGWSDTIEDFNKALCYMTGTEWTYDMTFSNFLHDRSCRAGEFYSWGFFDFRAYKKGTVHFTFQDENLWAKFNQRIAKILGFPLPESMKPKSTNEQKPEPKPETKPQTKPVAITKVQKIENPIPIIPEPVDFQEENDLELVDEFENPNQLSMF